MACSAERMSIRSWSAVQPEPYSEGLLAMIDCLVSIQSSAVRRNISVHFNLAATTGDWMSGNFTRNVALCSTTGMTRPGTSTQSKLFCDLTVAEVSMWRDRLQKRAEPSGQVASIGGKIVGAEIKRTRCAWDKPPVFSCKHRDGRNGRRSRYARSRRTD